ncbi:MAG: 4-(cytidine 5'-diphospho)-2-C-methyl-D-erythritol kinase [Neorhizobium sp.]|nr:4-(cytidine 5'-diphospho)-2-C-methyl-D-erythritol kinase [Neorhizobium sp.]
MHGLASLDQTRPAQPAGLFEWAPAKINLALHVVGQRPDGYHLLESIVTFSTTGDRLSFTAADADRFTLSGRFSSLLDHTTAADNLVLKARDMMRRVLAAEGYATEPVAIHLEKNLPVAAGIGGGSADAAATLRGLMRLWQALLPTEKLSAIALSLGADVPMCLDGRPLLARGIGEDITPLPELPRLFLVLGNPLVGVSTPSVFKHLARKDNPAIPEIGADIVGALARLRNDLEPPARTLAPEIAAISQMIAGEGASLTRMSGSGATCFGLFSSAETAERAAARLQAARPDWYFQAMTTTGAP